MRKTIATLMTLGVLSGCGGDEKTTAGAGAPTLALTLASTAEGGEIIPIGVTVKDDEDTGLAYDLSCSGGVLTGTLLTTPEVEADTTITCTATATDSKGNTGSAKATVTVKPATVALSSYVGSDEPVAAGGVGLLFAENLPLEQEQYEGSFNGQTVQLIRVNGNELMYFIPTDMGAASGDLTVTVGARVLSVPLTVNAAIAVTDPRASVNAFLQDTKVTLNEVAASSGVSSVDREMVLGYLPQLDEAIATLKNGSDEEVAAFASFLAANGLIDVPGRTTASLIYDIIKTGDSCKLDAANYGKSLSSKLIGLGMVAGGVYMMEAGVLPGPGWVSAIGGTVVAAAGVTLLWKGEGWLLGKYREAFNKSCRTESSLNIFPTIPDTFSTNRTVSAITLSAKPSFRKGKQATFKLERSFDTVSSVRAQAVQYAKDISTTLAAVSILPEGMKEELLRFKVSGSETVPASRLSISNISTGKVTGSIVPTADERVFALKFDTSATAEDLTDGKLPFSFQINRTDEESAIVNAEMVLTLPEAFDAAVEVTQFENTSSSVTTVGAETLHITTGAAHGTVVLQDTGDFSYAPTGNYFGKDEFKYVARNSDGDSKEATVLIDVVRKFDGVWDIVTTSTTTSESKQGICPNEAKRFQSSVSKISDTQYSASYGGYTIVMNMGSKDAPSGPSGSISVTYEDEPGETTETLSLSIPDSAHLSGSGGWSYKAPDGTYCTGSTSVTGTRP